MELGWFEVALNVSDLARSRAFYEAVGFEAHGDSAENGVAALYKDDCSVTLYQGHLDPARPQLIFWQGDVRAIARAFEAANIEFFRPLKTDAEGGGAFMLRDPDGHPVFFISMKKYDGNSPIAGADGKRVKARQYPATANGKIDLGWFEFSLPVADPEASRSFYRTLGLKSVGETNTLALNDCRIALFGLWLERPQLIFWQGDIDAIERELTGRGLRFEPRFNDGKATGAMLKDPDGHPLYFINKPGETRREPA
ncbi:MAG TPA: VOC family protein [Rhizomicrobium sp.]|nr:VOC family protein [Rhizomicrobium sp.]